MKDEMKTNHICMIIPYFGREPEWFNLYLYSCSKQDNVDFYYYTDCLKPVKQYPNTHFIYLSYDKYCQIVSQRLNISFHPAYTYKLADLKPFLAIVHEEIISKYDWWSFGDLDLIFGDIGLLMNVENMSRYDVITSHADRIAGHFTAIRTKSDYTDLILSCKNWKLLMQKEETLGVDEHYFSELVNPLYKVISFVYRHFLSYLTHDPVRTWNVLQSITGHWHQRVLFKEMYTSPVPKSKDQAWYYYPVTSEIVSPSDAYEGIYDSKCDGKMYLHFLFFKKTKYYDTQNYWRPGFYKIPSDYDFSQSVDSVKITSRAIELEKI